MDYDKIMFYSHDTQTYSSWYPVQVNGEGNFVYDKTTDSAKYEIISDIKLNIKIGQWAFVLHTQNVTDTALTFNSDGTPLNHEQYTVAKFENNHLKSGKWSCKLALQEPIEMMRGVATETLSFTNQTTAIAKEGGSNVTYIKTPYTCLTALERLLKVTPANNEDFNSVDYRNNNNWYNRIKIYNKDYLDSISFADDTFTAGDLYTILFKFDDIVDRTPVLYFDFNVAGEHNLIITDTTTGATLELGSGGVYDIHWYDNYTYNQDTGFTISEEITDFADYSVGGTYYYLDSSSTSQYFSKFIITQKIGGSNFKLIGTLVEYQFNLITNGNYYMDNLSKPSYRLVFERKDGFDKTELNFNTLIADNLGYSESDSIDTYATGVVSEVDNLTTNTDVIVPAINMWIVPQLDTDERDTSTGTSDKGKWFLKLPFGIKFVKQIKKLSLGGVKLSADNSLKDFYRTNLEVSPKYILEKQQYLASDYFADSPDSLCHWEEGDDKLYINEYFSDEDLQTAIYYVEYEPLINTKFISGDGDYFININQVDSQAESLKYSQFLDNYLKGMNSYDIIFIKQYTNFSEFSNLIGSRVVNNDDVYIISKISYKHINSTYLVSFQLNKDNLRRNANVKASEQIRANKAIAYSNLKDRRVLLKYNAKISLTPIIINNDFLMDNGLLLYSPLLSSSTLGFTSAWYPQNAYITFTSKLTKSDLSSVTKIKSFLFNICRVITKDGIQFIVTADNAMVGVKKVPKNDYVGMFLDAFDDIQSQIPLIYTDPFGEVQKVTFRLCQIDSNTFDDIVLYTGSDATKKLEFARTKEMYIAMANLPEIDTDIINNTILAINGINLLKDSLEKFNFSLNIKAKALDGIIVCTNMFKLSRFNQMTDTHTLKVFGFANKMKEDDLMNGSLFELNATSSVTYGTRKITISFTGQTNANLKSIVVTTNTNEKLLILNKLDDILTNINNGYIDLYI